MGSCGVCVSPSLTVPSLPPPIPFQGWRSWGWRAALRAGGRGGTAAAFPHWEGRAPPPAARRWVWVVGVASRWAWPAIGGGIVYFLIPLPPPPSPLLQSGSGSPGGGSGGGVPAGGGLSPAEVAELFQRLAQSQQERWLLEEKVLGAMGRGWEGAREAEGIQGREWRALGGEWGREGGEVGGGRWEGGGGTCRGKDGGGRTGVGIRKGCGVILGWVWGAVGAVRGGWEGIQAMKWEYLLLGVGLGAHRVGNRGTERDWRHWDGSGTNCWQREGDEGHRAGTEGGDRGAWGGCSTPRPLPGAAPGGEQRFHGGGSVPEERHHRELREGQPAG